MTELEELFVNDFGVSEDDLNKALDFQKKYSGRLEQILLSLGICAEETIARAISKFFNLPLLEHLPLASLPHLPDSLNSNFLKEQKWILISQSDLLVFATCNPFSDKVSQYLSCENVSYEVQVCTETLYRELERQTPIDELADSMADFEGMGEEELRELATEAPVVNLVNSLINRGITQKASDMHIEPYYNISRVRLRIDGVLQDLEHLPQHLRIPVISRLKILSGMDIAEKRRPQDGKIAMKVAGKDIDIRVSVIPLSEGESMVMRFLVKQSVSYTLSDSGIEEDNLSLIKEDLAKTAGVILLTGPTGSGKTTTLYSFLNELNNDTVKIITLEDPVEYQLEGINQIPVNAEIGFTFAKGLRSVVRQDPDIIMLGEIRDEETARIAMQSALTGHLVFSTLHTNNAPASYTRLLDLGVEDFLLNSALISIIAQRLVRRVCPECSEPVKDQQALIKQYGLGELATKVGVDNISIRQGRGCKACKFKGYSGRMAITEYLPCDKDIQALPKDEKFLANARAHMYEKSYRSLFEDGLVKVLRGQTTLAEVSRVCG